MKTLVFVSVMIFSVFYKLEVKAQTNLDFSNGFDGWVGHLGHNNPPIELTEIGMDPIRQYLVTPTDSIYSIDCAGPIGCVPIGSINAAGLGNFQSDSQAESLSYTWIPDTSQSLLVLDILVFLQHPDDHLPNEQPQFVVRVIDDSGVPIECGEYWVSASSQIPGWQSCNTSEWGEVIYLPWRSLAFNIENYIGQELTLQCITADCSLGGHWSASFFTAKLMELSISSSYCDTTTGAIELTAPPGMQYIWSNGETTQTIIVESPQPGDLYEVTLTPYVDVPCSVNISIELQATSIEPVMEVLSACTNATQLLGTAEVVNGEMANVIWELDGNIYIGDLVTHAFESDGDHTGTLIIETVNGCADSMSFVIETSPPPIISFEISNFCSGLTATLTSTSQSSNDTPVSVEWYYNGQISELQDLAIQDLTAGEIGFGITVTDESGCQAALDTFVVVPTSPISTIDANPYCANLAGAASSISTTYSTSTQYEWGIDGQYYADTPSIELTGLSPGTHLLTLTVTETYDSGPCGATTSKSLEVYPVPDPGLSIIGSACTSETHLLNETEIDGDASLTFLWNLDGVQSSTSEDFIFGPVNSGPHAVGLTAISPYDCVSSFDTTVVIHPTPIPGMYSLAPCAGSGEGVGLTANTEIEYGEVNHEWQWIETGETGSGDAFNPIVGSPSVISIWQLATSDQGCMNDTTMVIEIYPQPLADFELLDLCEFGEPIFEDLSQTDGGTITWQLNGSSMPLEEILSFLPFAPGQHLIAQTILEVHGAGQCQDNIETLVTVHDKPETSIIGDMTICEDVEVEFAIQTIMEIPEPIIHAWSLDSVLIAAGEEWTYYFAQPGEYPLSVESLTNFGCKDTAYTAIVVYDAASVSLPSYESCMPLEVEMIPEMGSYTGEIMEVMWLVNGSVEGTGATYQATMLSPDVWDVEFVVTTGDANETCTTNALASLIGFPDPTLIMTLSDEYLNEEQPQIFVSAAPEYGTTYELSVDGVGFPGQLEFSHTFPHYSPTSDIPHLICLFGVTSNGCEGEICEEVWIEDLTQVYLPNAFTPNGDGINDAFTASIDNIELVKNYSLSIFNKWGEKIFESSSPSVAWNGSISDGEYFVEDGVYAYVLKLDTKEGPAQELHGHVLLTR